MTAVFALRAARVVRHPVHPGGDGGRPDHPDRADHRGADAPDGQDLWAEYRDELTAMDIGPVGRMTTLLWDARFSLVTALLADSAAPPPKWARS